MMTVTAQNLVHAFFNDRLGLHYSHDFRGALYVPDEFTAGAAQMEHVAVAVGYNAFIGRTCCMHSVIQRPDLVSPRIVREAFEFPFRACNCEAVLALVDSTNAAALNFDTKLGFVELHRIPNGGPDADLVVMQMLRADCRWLKKTH